MTLVLSPDELVELTAKEKPSAQARELTHMKIPFKPRRDGTLVVMRIHVVTEMPDEPDTSRPEPRLRFG